MALFEKGSYEPDFEAYKKATCSKGQQRLAMFCAGYIHSWMCVAVGKGCMTISRVHCPSGETRASTPTDTLMYIHQPVTTLTSAKICPLVRLSSY